MTSLEELDHKLIQDLKDGSEDAFCKIYECYNSLIYHLAFQYLQNTEDARDIVQETFIRLWNTRKMLSEHKKLNNYLFTIAKNLCINLLSKRKNSTRYKDKASRTEINFHLKALEATDPSKLFQKEIHTLVQQALEEASPEAREVFCLSRYSGKTNKEIAEDLNIKVKTVEYHMARILKILRIKLKDFLSAIIHIFII